MAKTFKPQQDPTVSPVFTDLAEPTAQEAAELREAGVAVQAPAPAPEDVREAAPGVLDTPPPRYATPRTADGKVVPRVVKPIERAPEGLRRYKVRCTDPVHLPQPYLYVLAHDEAEARACYLQNQRLDRVEPAPALTVTKLRD